MLSSFPNISSHKGNKDFRRHHPTLTMILCRLVDHPYLHHHHNNNTLIIRRQCRHRQRRMLLEGIHSSHIDGSGIIGSGDLTSCSVTCINSMVLFKDSVLDLEQKPL